MARCEECGSPKVTRCRHCEKSDLEQRVWDLEVNYDEADSLNKCYEKERNGLKSRLTAAERVCEAAEKIMNSDHLVRTQSRDPFPVEVMGIEVDPSQYGSLQAALKSWREVKEAADEA